MRPQQSSVGALGPTDQQHRPLFKGTPTPELPPPRIGRWTRSRSWKRPDAETASIMIDCYARHNMVEEILTVKEFLRSRNMHPTPDIFNSLAAVYARLHRLREAQSTLSEMNSYGVIRNRSSHWVRCAGTMCNAILPRCLRQPLTILLPHTASSKVDIGIRRLQRNSSQAISSFCEMVARGYVPDWQSYELLVSGMREEERRNAIVSLYDFLRSPGCCHPQELEDLIKEREEKWRSRDQPVNPSGIMELLSLQMSQESFDALEPQPALSSVDF
mmetsp:Transcript_9256/g.13529  ORF Transcript_9256/g.13529 Transcript_9256/m.13529 type:complete len:273 (+) Transcript_9256:627-1445(+)